jgi:BirA family biotin operon repressor/biotin-[acetyl-CoA-carboxylase] ligase
MNHDFDSRLVSFLSANESCSGEAIALELGCSRTAVWKHIQSLRDLGIEVDAVAGQGYRLKEPLELLDHTSILKMISDRGKAKPKELVLLGTVDSSNSWLQSRPWSEQAGVVVLAESQTSGRGRRGQKWISPFGRNLYLSLGWKFESGMSDLGCLPLLVALSACDALENVGVRGHKIKWPNDILLNRKKLGGCLVEVQGDVNGPCYAVMGVGLNVFMPESAPGAAEIDQPWTDVSSEVSGVSRNELASLLIDALFSRLQIFSESGFAPFMSDWKTHDALTGSEVTLSKPDKSVRGVALGISDRGGLMLQTDWVSATGVD